jgi:hypothetical protein
VFLASRQKLQASRLRYPELSCSAGDGFSEITRQPPLAGPASVFADTKKAAPVKGRLLR